MDPAAQTLRAQNIDRLDGGHFDVFIVGGGINGAASAASLAGRGLTVALADRADFASVTSQESSNLVWGGFKYLQNYELPLVFKLCRSRNKLMRAYPTGITEVGFLATLDKSAPFPSWLAALGSVGYWGIGAFATRRPRFFRRNNLKRLEPVIDTSSANAAIDYADAYLKENDSRFVWSFVRSALDAGATAANYLSVESAERNSDGRWTMHLRDVTDDRLISATADAVINAAGPFVDGLNEELKVSTKHRIVYSKGIHLVVPRLTASERVLAFFDDTQRLFYVIPMANRSVIGTTDTRTTVPQEPATDEDRRFLLEQINARLSLDTPLSLHDIIAERSGVRPLVVMAGDEGHSEVDWTSLSRKHEMEIDHDRNVVSIFGGKLTDCLNIGDEVAEAISDLGIKVGSDNDEWYGEPPIDERRAFYRRAATVGLDRAPDVERAESLAEVLWRRHGMAANEIIDAVAADPDQGQPLFAESDVLRAELDLFHRREMIVSVDDLLRRRTKLALIHRAEDLAADPGMAEVSEIFGKLTKPASGSAS
ncbi:MAG: glycerol-3-phosphate dehydrogenase/oxidase [Acidimicrobiales bacterium]